MATVAVRKNHRQPLKPILNLFKPPAKNQTEIRPIQTKKVVSAALAFSTDGGQETDRPTPLAAPWQVAQPVLPVVATLLPGMLPL
jgi:hypothetical protein